MSGSLNADFERRPYWHATMPSLPDRTGRPLPERADVVVVGGGYTGVAAARRLALDGAAVTLLEANQLGWGASTRNGGIIHPGFKWSAAALERRHGTSLGRALFRDTIEGYEYVKQVIRDEGIDCEFRERGHLELAWGARHVREFPAVQRALAELGISSRIVGRDELRGEIGTSAYAGALAIEQSGLLHPGKWFAGLAAAADRAGADLHEGVRALGIRFEGNGRMVVETDRGSIGARDVLVATNGYPDGLVPAIRRRILPIGSYIIASERLPEEVADELSPRGRAFYDTKNFLNYWHVSADRRMIFGGRVSFMPTSVEATAAILHRTLLRVHPQLAGYRIEYAWGGKVALTMDRMPHAGRIGGVAYATGYCGTGVAMSTWLGTKTAEWMAGGPPPLLARLPFRLVPAPYEGRPWFLPLVGEWYRLRDRLARRERVSA